VPPQPPNIALLACSVFEREIALLTRDARHIVETRWFEIGLHDQPDNLRTTLQRQLDEIATRADVTTVVLAYGLCGRGTAGLQSQRHKLVGQRQLFLSVDDNMNLPVVSGNSWSHLVAWLGMICPYGGTESLERSDNDAVETYGQRA